MFAHDCRFFRRKRARLAKDGVRDRHFTNVVQERPAGNHADTLTGEAHGPGNRDGERRYALGVALGFGVLEIKGVAQGLKRDVIRALQVGHGLAKLLGPGGNQRFQVGLISPVLQLEPAVLERAPHHGQKLLTFKRFKEVIVSAIADGRQRY